MKKLKDIFTEEIIQYYKKNKHEITSKLLETIRGYGNEGKHLALEILDIEKDEEQYYLDAFGNRMSFMGNRRLKKSFTKLDLSPIHIEEIKKCCNDLEYYKDNYIRIKTKSGINFPDMRTYQNEFIDIIKEDENENIVGLLPRQSGKSSTVAIYLSHCFIFMKDRNIGIVANRGAQAREFLSTTKNILLELPIWLQIGVNIWNKGSIEGENGMRILTDVPSSDSFRGFTVACIDGKSLIDVYDKKDKKYKTITIEQLYSSCGSYK